MGEEEMAVLALSPLLHTAFSFQLLENKQTNKNLEMPAPEEQHKRWETEAKDSYSHDGENHFF